MPFEDGYEPGTGVGVAGEVTVGRLPDAPPQLASSSRLTANARAIVIVVVLPVSKLSLSTGVRTAVLSFVVFFGCSFFGHP